MTKEAAFITGFVKSAMATGLTEAQAHAIFKKAEGDAGGGWMEQLKGLGGKAQEFAQQNPTGAGAIAGGLGGAAIGGMSAGQGNRMKGMLGGGAVGAGLGGAAGLSQDPEMQAQLMELLGLGGPKGRHDASGLASHGLGIGSSDTLQGPQDKYNPVGGMQPQYPNAAGGPPPDNKALQGLLPGVDQSGGNRAQLPAFGQQPKLTR